MAASISGYNPIVITSGMTNTLITNDNVKVKHFYWLQPDLSSTSSLLITKGDANGAIYNMMKVEVSGQSQIQKVDMWCDKMFCACVPSGTLFIYTH